jgi:hypothetical protein
MPSPYIPTLSATYDDGRLLLTTSKVIKPLAASLHFLPKPDTALSLQDQHNACLTHQGLLRCRCRPVRPRSSTTLPTTTVTQIGLLCAARLRSHERLLRHIRSLRRQSQGHRTSQRSCASAQPRGFKLGSATRRLPKGPGDRQAFN